MKILKSIKEAYDWARYWKLRRRFSKIVTHPRPDMTTISGPRAAHRDRIARETLAQFNGVMRVAVEQADSEAIGKISRSQIKPTARDIELGKMFSKIQQEVQEIRKNIK